MIENKLTHNELKGLLIPFLRLKSKSNLLNEVGAILGKNLKCLDQISDYTEQYNVCFNNFKLFVSGIDELSQNSNYIHIQLKTEVKWWHSFIDPKKFIINFLKKICEEEIEGVNLVHLKTRGYDMHGGLSIDCICDSSSINYNWHRGNEISSLMICPEKNEKYHFVSFCFNSNCYYRIDNKTVLKSNWENYISDIGHHIDTLVAERIKLGAFKIAE